MDLDIFGASIISFTPSFVTIFLQVFTLHDPIQVHCFILCYISACLKMKSVWSYDLLFPSSVIQW